MSQGSKSKYSAKQKRQAQHIEDSEKKSGRSAKSAARIAWATVNKQDGGAKKSASSSKAKLKPSGKRGAGALRASKKSRSVSRSSSMHA